MPQDEEERSDPAALIARVQTNDAQLATIEHAWFSKNSWSPAELSSLFHALHSNTHVVVLELSEQRALQSTEVMEQFAHMLAVNRSIRTLDVSNCPCDGALLAHGLKKHPTLAALWLNDVDLRESGMQTLFLALVDCPALRSICLWDCVGIVPPSMTELCTLLHQTRSLRNLTLSNCGLHGAPLHQLTDALSTSEHLLTLDLSNNTLDDEDAHCLADFLQNNGTLRTLDLIDNETIGVLGWHALADALQFNHALVDLYSVIHMARADQRAIDVCLTRNKNTSRRMNCVTSNGGHALFFSRAA